MATLHFQAKTTATPDQFLAALTDFGPGRSQLFGNSADEYLEVHEQGPDWADVTEGSGGVWERLHYDWSDPRHIVMATTDSNVWGGASGHTYTLTTLPEGTTVVNAAVVREGKNVKGRLLALVLGTIGKGKLRNAFENTIEAVWARSIHSWCSSWHCTPISTCADTASSAPSGSPRSRTRSATSQSCSRAARSRRRPPVKPGSSGRSSSSSTTAAAVPSSAIPITAARPATMSSSSRHSSTSWPR